jgi:hypothetical protein
LSLDDDFLLAMEHCFQRVAVVETGIDRLTYVPVDDKQLTRMICKSFLLLLRYGILLSASKSMQIKLSSLYCLDLVFSKVKEV